jgi:hypothetical protein
MTKQKAAMRFLLTIAEFALARFRRLLKRLSGPGAGPFLAGC